MRIPVLCYHSQILANPDYQGNGHRALAQDLETITAIGGRIVPLSWVVDWHQGRRSDEEMRDAVAITFDDGMLSDFTAVEHPEFGPLPGFLPVLEAFSRSPAGRRQPHLHASVFVIVSDRARQDIDRHCQNGIGWDRSEWWQHAADHPLITVENHSWDHNHEVCDEAPASPKGTFRSIDCFDDCEHELRQAVELLRQRGLPGQFFAYPYGNYSDYLSQYYLPVHGPALGLNAAFTTAGYYVTRADSVWRLPRFVHGYHWRDSDEFRQLLSAARDTAQATPGRHYCVHE